MKHIKHPKELIIEWLRKNDAAPTDVIAGHVFGLGLQKLNRTQNVLRALRTEGRIVSVDGDGHALLWSIARPIKPIAKVIKFPNGNNYGIQKAA